MQDALSILDVNEAAIQSFLPETKEQMDQIPEGIKPHGEDKKRREQLTVIIIDRLLFPKCTDRKTKDQSVDVLTNKKPRSRAYMHCQFNIFNE